MILTAWRVIPKRRRATAFDGEGARLYGGRWNHEGTPLVYCAESLSLAALEQLVHVSSPMLLTDYCCISAKFDDSLCGVLERESLPLDWRTTPAPISTRDLGSAWVNSQSSAVLAVPSIIIPSEKNYLLNPSHSDFKRIKIGAPEDFPFDPRLFK